MLKVGRSLLTLVVSVEARPLEDHTDLAELLAEGVLPALGAGLESIVAKGLVLLKHMVTVLALVNVNGHENSLDSGPGKTHRADHTDLYLTLALPLPGPGVRAIEGQDALLGQGPAQAGVPGISREAI